jgi:hypothetical protein
VTSIISRSDLLRVPETLPSGLVADLKKYDREVVDILMDEWATKLRQGAKAKASAVAELDRLHARLQAMRAMMEAYKAGVTFRLDGGKVKVAGPNASREVQSLSSGNTSRRSRRYLRTPAPAP